MNPGLRYTAGWVRGVLLLVENYFGDPSKIPNQAGLNRKELCPLIGQVPVPQTIVFFF